MVARPTHQETTRLISAGFNVVAGVDEVGRGSWAGPVVAAAVILTPSCRLPGVRDSKLVKPSDRIELADLIKRRAMAVGLGWSSHGEVDRYGLTWAVRQSGLRALNNLDRPFDVVILDGNHNYLKRSHRAVAIIRADQTCLNVAAASIVAKVARDRYMQLMHRLYPQYGFSYHKGYGTPKHRRVIQLGLSPIHRRRFKPIMMVADVN